MAVLMPLTSRTNLGGNMVYISGCTKTQQKLFWGYQVAHNCHPLCLFSLSSEHQRSGHVNMKFGSPLPEMHVQKRMCHIHSSVFFLSSVSCFFSPDEEV